MDKLLSTVNYLKMHKLIIMIFLVAGVLIGVLARGSLNSAAHKESEDIVSKTVKSTDEASGVTVRAPKDGFNPAYVSCERAGMGWVPEQIPVTGKLAFDAEKLHLVSSRVRQVGHDTCV